LLIQILKRDNDAEAQSGPVGLFATRWDMPTNPHGGSKFNNQIRPPTISGGY